MIEIRSLQGVVLMSVDAASLRGANLLEANLLEANLGEANLQGANLRGAYLEGANLRGANLGGVSLVGANLGGANLWGANLWGANLWGANLGGANLVGANLVGANLGGANLGGANLVGAKISPHYVCPTHGSFTAWKRIEGCLVELQIPADARRVSSLVGRKCRAECAVVVAVTGPNGAAMASVKGGHDPEFIYAVGETVRPDSFDDDTRLECTHGIHFFISPEEAEAYQ